MEDGQWTIDSDEVNQMEINGKVVGGITIVLLLGALLYTNMGSWFGIGVPDQPKDQGTTTQQIVYLPGQTTPTPAVNTGGDNQVYPIETLKGQAKNMFTQAATTAGTIDAFTPGADVSDPYVNPMDNISVSSGSGSTTNQIIMTNTPYDWHFNGYSTYYDELIKGVTVSYNKDTGKGTLLFNGVAYYPAKPVGTLVNDNTLPEVQTGWNDTSDANVYYDASALSGAGWIKVDVGNSASNSVLEDVVLCFKDADSDMENNELTDFTASYVSGSTAISIPPSLFRYWQDAMGGGGTQCVLIANELGSSEQARWKFDLTVNEANFNSSEEFEMCFDDLGNYLQKQYPSRDAKAAASCITIGEQA